MKSLYKKWLNFEKEHGTSESVADVKEEIKKYAGVKDEDQIGSCVYIVFLNKNEKIPF